LILFLTKFESYICARGPSLLNPNNARIYVAVGFHTWLVKVHLENGMNARITILVRLLTKHFASAVDHVLLLSRSARTALFFIRLL
jgi:hypothetical protein